MVTALAGSSVSRRGYFTSGVVMDAFIAKIIVDVILGLIGSGSAESGSTAVSAILGS